jgi:hypothetical protein
MVGVISLTVAVLAAIQTFVGAPEKSERHKVAAVKYGELRHEIEVARVRPNSAEEIVLFMDLFRLKWDAVDRESLPIPRRFHDKSLTQVRDSMKHARELGFEDPQARSLDQSPGSERPATTPSTGARADG